MYLAIVKENTDLKKEVAKLKDLNTEPIPTPTIG